MKRTVTQKAGSRPVHSPMTLRLWLQMIRCAKVIERGLNARLRRHHAQSLSRFDVLSQLRRAPGNCLAVGRLSSQLILSNANITRLLDRMEQDGLIKRSFLRSDRRGVEVALTPAGATLFDAMAADHARWLEEIFADLPVTKQQKLHTLLVGLHDLLVKR